MRWDYYSIPQCVETLDRVLTKKFLGSPLIRGWGVNIWIYRFWYVWQEIKKAFDAYSRKKG